MARPGAFGEHLQDMGWNWPLSGEDAGSWFQLNGRWQKDRRDPMRRDRRRKDLGWRRYIAW